MTIDVETGVTSESCLWSAGGGMVREAIEDACSRRELETVPYGLVHERRRAKGAQVNVGVFA